MLSDNYFTYSDSARYTIFFFMAYYIPIGGSLRIILPTEIDIISNPYVDLESDTGLIAPDDQDSSYG